jgi:hypothetical protein
VAGWWTARLHAPGSSARLAQLVVLRVAERSYARLARAPQYELWLIRWPDGTSAPMHDHGGAAGVARMVEGTLNERVFVPGDPPRWREQRWTLGAAHRFGAEHLHEVWNESGRDAWSLHVYAPRLVTMRFYGGGEERLAPVRSETASQWL